MTRKHVRVVFTGGTISMRIDPETRAAVPALTGEEIVARVHGLRKEARLTLEDYARLPGPHVTPHWMWRLKDHVARLLAEDDVDAVVLTHGTDTLEETAFLFDLTLDQAKPVVFCGAMRTVSEPGWDGPANLMAAVVYPRPPFRRAPLGAARLVSEVDLHTMAAGMDDALIRASMSRGARGLVLEATGCGNVPPSVLPGLRAALAGRIPVVLVSRCAEGRVSPAYGYEGGGRMLEEMGVVFGQELPGPKARIKLMVALGVTSDPAEIRRIFADGAAPAR